MAGPLALAGGDEFHPGNEDQDRRLVAAARGRPAYVVCAAAREAPGRAAAAAARWFAGVGCEMTELRVRSRSDAAAPATADLARRAGLIYIAGGDPGRAVQLLSDSAVWAAIVEAWRHGAALAGSSAGAMALCQWTLVRDHWPVHDARRPTEALNLVPGCAVVPHFDGFGERWIPSAQASLGADVHLIGIDERTAAFWAGGAWTVVGPGRVTVFRGEDRTMHVSGEAPPGLPQPDAE